MAGESDLFFIEQGKKRPHEEAVARVVGSTFEKMGFMEARLTDEEPPPSNSITTVMEILSPVQTRMFFSAPEHLGWSIAENLYGLEDLTMEAVGDMMKELLNTITGGLLSELMPDTPFTLSIPTLCEDTQAGVGKTFVYHFNIDNKGIVTMILCGNDP